MNLWNPFEVRLNQVYQWRLGPWRLWLECSEKDWRLIAEADIEEDEAMIVAEECDTPEDKEWRRWMTNETSRVAHLTPVMPDRPVVVRPEAPIRILPRVSALFYVSVPVWIRIAVGRGKETTLIETPTMTLSNTWFGGYDSGEICYALRTLARREIGPEQVSPYRAICPVMLRNAADEPLEFTRFCLRVNFLKIFEGAGHLWTNETRVVFRGADRSSRISYSASPPEVEAVGPMLSDSRRPVNQGILRLNFDSLLALTGR